MGKEKNIQKLADNFMLSKSDKDFEELFKRLKPGVLNHCFLILKDGSLAEDAFLNTMSKIWLKIDQYDNSRGNFSTWCYNIARNESLFIIKSRNKTVTHNADNIEFLSSISTEDTICGVYTIESDPTNEFFYEGSEADVIYDIILDEIRALPEHYKDIMVDREINGMKYKDIADKYDIKKRSIATRIRRARAKIRNTIDGNIKRVSSYN